MKVQLFGRIIQSPLNEHVLKCPDNSGNTEYLCHFLQSVSLLTSQPCGNCIQKMSCIKDILFFKCFSLGSFQGMLYNFAKKFLDVRSAHLGRALRHVAAHSISSLEHWSNMLLYSKISSCQREFFGLDIISWFERNFLHQHFFISPYFSTAVFSFT